MVYHANVDEAHGWGGGEQLPELTESSESDFKQTKTESNFLYLIAIFSQCINKSNVL